MGEAELREALVTALADVKRGLDDSAKLMALVAILEADLTLAHDALATAHEDVLTVVRRLDVAMQAIVISRATRGQRLANLTPALPDTQPKGKT